MKEWVACIDYETWSECDIKTAGAMRYAQHSSTRVLMMAWHIIGDASPTELWVPGQPFPDKLRWVVNNGGRLQGWNSINFERFVWRYKSVPDHGWPEVSDDIWLDTMHLAAAANLPRSLDGAAKAVGATNQKDAEGHRLMLRVTSGKRTPWPPKPLDLQRLGEYCKKDVEAEEATFSRLPAWPTAEPWSRVPAINRRINDRGILMDVALVQGMAKAADQELIRLDAQMAQMTNGRVPKTSNVEALKVWLIDNGIQLPRADEKVAEEDRVEGEDDEKEEDPAKTRYRLRKSDMANILGRKDLPDHVRTVIEMRAEAAKASTKKLKAMLASASDDGRLRGALILGGAQQTLRWSGARWQPHNFVRNPFPSISKICGVYGLDEKKDKKRVNQIADEWLNQAILDGRSGDPDLIRFNWGPVLPWAGSMLRRCLTAPTGHTLLQGDYSSVEAKITDWVADQTEMLAAYHRGDDIYRLTASPVFGRKPADLNGEERQTGKIMKLGLGFLGGAGVFVVMGVAYGMYFSQEEAERYVKLFRETNPRLVRFGNENLDAAMSAVAQPGREFAAEPGLITYVMHGGALCCRLPSGRMLRYWAPRLERGRWPDGNLKSKPDLTALSIKGKAVFRRSLWRGLILENCLGEATLVVTASGLKKIVDVLPSDLLWDGSEWVAHSGVVCRGHQKTVDFGGIRITPDHKVLVNGEWKNAGDVSYERAAASYARHYRNPDWLSDSDQVSGDGRTPGDLADPVRLRKRKGDGDRAVSPRRSEVVRVQMGRGSHWAEASFADARYDDAPGVLGVALNERSLPASDAQGMEELWGTRDQSLRAVGEVFSELLGGYGADVSGGFDVGPGGQQRRLLPRELPLDDAQEPERQSARQYTCPNTQWGDDGGSVGSGSGADRPHDSLLPSEPRMAGEQTVYTAGYPKQGEVVYDLLNAGPRHRFTVVGADGRCVIVSNCVQAIAVDLLAGALARMEKEGFPVVLHVHDSIAAEVLEEKAEALKPVFEEIMAEKPDWAKGLPVGVDVKVSCRFA